MACGWFGRNSMLSYLGIILAFEGMEENHVKHVGFETWTSRKRSRISTQSIGALISEVIKNYT
jgi:hypothetical protein